MMKAAVFYLDSQDNYYRGIRLALEKCIFSGIDIDRYVISSSYSRASEQREHEACRLYLRMLRACMIRVEDFRIVVGNPPYSWCYLGYESDSEYLFADRVLSISRENLGAIFPAVAVRDRMVMVPAGIHDALEGATRLPWFLKPLDLHGVALVDFAEPSFIRDEMEQVGRQLEHEIVRLCARHAQMTSIQRPEFDELAKLLAIDISYLKQHEEKIVASLIKMKPRVLSDPVRLGEASPVVLEISESSGNTLKQVQVRVKGPRGTLEDPVGATLDFTADDPDSRLLRFVVTAQVRPYCPLEVRFESSGTGDRYAAFPVPVILDVAA
jgi:hypothetical protein